MKRAPAQDDDGNFILPGDKVFFSYGIPPVYVEAPVVTIRGELWALTPGHKPDKCRILKLREYVGGFYKVENPQSK